MADLNIEQLMNNSEAMRMLKIGNPERSEDFDIPKLDVGLFDIERQLKEPLKNALYNSPDPNGTIAKFDTALMLNNLGIDLDTAHKMADMGYMSTATGINTKDKNYFEALKTTAQHAWWQEMKGTTTSLYRITGNSDFLKHANEYQSKIDNNPLFNEYGGFGDLVLSGVQPTMSSMKFIATTALLSWLPGGMGLATGSKSLQGLAKVGGYAALGINFFSTGYSQAGNVLYDVINTEDAEGNKLPWDSPMGGVMFNALAGLMGVVEMGSMEMFPWYRALNNKFTKNQIIKHIQKGMIPAVKNFLWEGSKGTAAEAVEEGVQHLLSAGFENALKAMANKDGAEFELDSVRDTIKEAARQTYEAGKSMFLTSFLTAGAGQVAYSTKMSLESKRNFSRTKTSVSIDPFFVNIPNPVQVEEKRESPQKEDTSSKGKENQDSLEPIQTVRVGGRLIPTNEAELEKVRTAQERGAKVLEVEVSEEIPTSGVDQTALTHQAALATEGKILNESTVVYEDQGSLNFAMYMLSPNIEATTKTENGYEITLRNEEGTISTLNLALAQEQMELRDPDLAYVEDETAPYALSRMKEEQAYKWHERELVKRKIGDLQKHTGGKVSSADMEANVDATILVANTLNIPTDELLEKNVIINLAETVVTPEGKEARGSVEQNVVDGEKRYVINLSKKADVSTLLHELGHTLRGLATPEQLADFKKHYSSEEFETAFLDDIQQVDGKFSVANKTFDSYTEASTYVNKFEERFADDFVAYLRTGQAPTAELTNIFSRMKAVLSKLIREFGDRLTPDVKEAFDNLITGKAGSDTAGISDTQKNVIFQQAPPVNSQAFKNWFKDSKVVDENGDPLVVYHGTASQFSVFEEDSGVTRFGKGFSFTNGYGVAEDFANSRAELLDSEKRIIEAYMALQRPFDITDDIDPNTTEAKNLIKILKDQYGLDEEYTKQVLSRENDQGGDAFTTLSKKIFDEESDESSMFFAGSPEKLRNLIEQAGYDGMIGKYSDVNEYFAFSSTQIKSVDNQGTWDVNNPSILYQESIDDRYFKALENGDMEIAQKIVDDQARKKGYISNNDFRISHQAPNGHDDYSVNLANIEDTDLIPDGYWEHPSWYASDEEMRSFRIVKGAIDKFRKIGHGRILLFRSIPKTVKEDMFRNGDWVTPDPEYARTEGLRIPGGYRLISHSVPLEHVWWDVNSIAELGYDDGNSYAYRDTLNNRKLTDAVVYDVDGTIVPPSKRFNYRSYTLYQRVEEKQKIREYLDGDPIATTSLDDVPYLGKIGDIASWADEWFKEKNLKNIHRNDIGEVELTRRGVKDSLSHGITTEKVQGLLLIPEVIRKGVLIYSGEKQGYQGYVIASPVKIGDEEYIELVMLRRKGQAKGRLYVHEVLLKEKSLSASKPIEAQVPDGHQGLLKSLLRDIYSVNHTLYQLSPEAKQHLLEIRKDEVRTAVENFFYIPQDVLEEYAGEEWADEEIRFRVHLKENPLLLEEAKNYGIADEYLEYIKSYVETGDYEFSLDDKMWFLRIHAYSKIQDPKQKDAQFVRLNTGTDKALIALGKELRGYEDVDYKGNTNRRNYDGRFVRYHWGSFKGVSTKVKRLNADSTAEELQEARDLIKANPRPYRKAVQIVEAARARVQEMKGYISSGDVGRDEYYDALGEEMEEALNEPVLLNGMTNRQAAEYLRTSSDKKERYNTREKLATHAGVYAMEQQANAELKKLGVEKDSEIKKLENQLRTAQADRNLYAKELKEEKKKYSEARQLGNSLGKALEERRARVKALRTLLTEANEIVRSLTKKVTTLKNRIETRALKEKLEKLHKKILATVVFNSDSIDASFEEAFNVIHSLFEQDQRPGGFKPLPQQMSQYIVEEQLRWVQQGKKITQWSLGDLEVLYEAAQLMRADAKVMLEQKKVERMNKLQNISAQMYKQQYGSMPEMGVGYGSIMNDIIDDLTTNRDSYDENIFNAIFNTVRSSIGKMQRISRMLDGNKEGVAYQLFVRKAYEKMTEELRESYRRLTEADEKMKELKITADLLAKDTFKYTTTSGQQKTLTIGEVIGLYVYSQNPLGTQKLVHNRGNNISPLDLAKAIGSLTENEKAWGDYMLDNLGSDEVWERMNRTYIDVYNRNLGRRQRYFTFVADGKVDEGKTDLLVGPQGSKVRYVDKDFTKIVNPHAIYPLKLNVTHTFTSQVKKQEHFVQWASWVRDMNYLLTKGAVGRIIEMNYGPKYMNVVQEYVNDVGSPQVILDDIERIGSKIISNAAVAALSLNFLTMLKQLPSFSAALRGDVGAVELTNVALRLSNPKTHSEAIQFIHEMSPYMLKRSISIEVEKYNASDFDSFVGRKVQAFNENIGMKGIQMMDQTAVNTLWLAAYDTYVRRNPQNLSGEALKKEAAFRATQLISETQPTSIANDLSSLQRKKNPWVRTALLFSNQLFQYVNMVWYDLPTSAKAYMATKDSKELKKMFGIVTNMAISGAMIVLVSGVAFRKDGEDDDDYWKRIRKEIMKMTASYSLPVIGGDVGQGISGWSYGGDLVDLPSSFGRMLGADWTDLDKISDRAWDVLDGAGSIGGLPTAFINRVIKSVKTDNPFEMFGSSYGDLWEKWYE